MNKKLYSTTPEPLSGMGKLKWKTCLVQVLKFFFFHSRLIFFSQLFAFPFIFNFIFVYFYSSSSPLFTSSITAPEMKK